MIHKLDVLINQFISKLTNLKFIKYILFFSICLAGIVVVVTIFDLMFNYTLKCTKDGFITFLDAFNWKYIAPSFAVLSVYIALSTYKTHESNRKYNNIIKPRVEALNSKLHCIEKQNIVMFSYVSNIGGYIIENICYDENRVGVKSKDDLTKYFNDYIKTKICDFEKCGYHHRRCSKIGSCNEYMCGEDVKLTYLTRGAHSMKSFLIIAYELFCVSPEYKDFENDIKQLYQENVNSHSKP